MGRITPSPLFSKTMKTTKPFKKFPRIYSHSFAARLTEAQREELFTALSNGLKYDDGAALVRGWMKANAAALPPGTPPGRPITLSSGSSIGKWFNTQQAARRYAKARDAAQARWARTRDTDPTEARHALEQARAAAVMEGLRPTEIAAFERTELAREKLELEREKVAYQRRRDAVVEEARVLLQRATRDRGADLDQQVELILEEIEKMKRGEP